MQSVLKNGFYIALIYLVISGNYLGNLFGCRVQQMFSQSVAMKHVLGLFTTYFLIILSTPPEDMNHKETLGFSLGIYTWFFFTTKMHVSFWIPMISIMLIAYGLYVFQKQAVKNNEKRDEHLELVQTVCTVLGAIVTIVGVLTYYGEKKLEYKSNFTPYKFWAALPSCRGKTPTVPILKSLKAAFL
jgi:hypothetical protein